MEKLYAACGMKADNEPQQPPVACIPEQNMICGDRCFGLAANMDFLLVCTYGPDGDLWAETDSF